MSIFGRPAREDDAYAGFDWRAELLTDLRALPRERRAFWFDHVASQLDEHYRMVDAERRARICAAVLRLIEAE
jgi:hypothetical protein